MYYAYCRNSNVENAFSVMLKMTNLSCFCLINKLTHALFSPFRSLSLGLFCGGEICLQMVCMPAIYVCNYELLTEMTTALWYVE